MIKNRLLYWVTASTVKCVPGVIIVVDSLVKSINVEIILNLFQHNSESQPKIKLAMYVIKSQQQKGTKACGVFAIAMVTLLPWEKTHLM